MFLPDGRHVLFTEVDPTDLLWADEARRIVVVDIETGKRSVVMSSAWYGRYSSTGHLLYARGDVVFVAPFDSKRLEVTGPSAPLLNDVETDRPLATAFFAVSSDGTAAYLRKAPPAEQEVVWIDRKGTTQSISTIPAFGIARVSPEGQRIAVEITGSDRTDLWVYDLPGGSRTRLTFEADNQHPVWSPDGRQILFESNRVPPYNVYVISADGTGEPRQITHRSRSVYGACWSGRIVAFETKVPTTGFDIWMMDIEDEKTARPFLNSRFDERSPSLSPDGRWIAYITDESGRSEVYVQPFPGPGPKWRISTDGGSGLPRWSRDARRLFYRYENKLMEVDIETKPTFRPGKPRLVFETTFNVFDVAPDGRFLLLRDKEKPKPTTEISVVQGLLKPAGRLIW